MSTYRSVVFFILIVFVFVTGTAYSEDLVIEKCDLAHLRGLASAKNTDIIINFYAYWCPVCRDLYKNTLSLDGVKRILSRYVFARCDGEEGEGERLFNKYRVTAFPTLLILNAGGKEIGRLVDEIDESRLKRALDSAKSGVDELEELAKRSDANPKDLDTGFNVCMSYIFRADREKAKRYCERVLKLDQKNEKGYASRVLLSLGKYLYFRGLKDYDLAAAHLEQVVKLFPESKEARSAFVFLISSYIKGGKEGVAMMRLRGLIKKDPNSKEPYKTFAYVCWRNKWRIDQGIKNAKKAVDLDPKDDNAWDLLAELYFLKGDKEAALRSEDEAIKLRPQEDYYKEQKKRFSR